MTDRLTYLDALQRLKDAAMAYAVAESGFTVPGVHIDGEALLRQAAEDYASASLRTGLGDPVRLAPDAGAVLDARD